MASLARPSETPLVAPAARPDGAVAARTEFYRLLFEYATDAIISVRLTDLRVTSANRRVEEMFGYPVGALLGDSAEKIFPDRAESSGQGTGFSRDVLAHPGLHDEIRIKRADDHSLYASIAVGHVPTNEGVTAVCIIRDATERRLLERELITKHMALRQAHQELLDVTRRLEARNQELVRLSKRVAILSKQAAIGALTAGVAHSINNPLAAVISAARCTATILDVMGPEPAAERLRALNDRLKRAAVRIKGVVENIRRTHRGGAPRGDPAQIDVAEEIDSVLALLAHRFDGLEVVRRYGQVPQVLAFPDALQHLFANVIENAALATEGHGRIEIETGVAADNLYVRVTDDGPGIAASVRDQLFEPFITSRAGGTGLGLWIAKCLAQHHRGSLVQEDVVERGACFVFEMPLAGVAETETCPEPTRRAE